MQVPPSFEDVRHALAWARAYAPASEARLLLRHALAVSNAWLLAHDDAPLSPQQTHSYVELITKRQAGTPIAYLTGEREFYGRSFHVSPATLIPRHDTETLIDQLLSHYAASPPKNVLDLGTGSGIIAITLALSWPQSHVSALDSSLEALEMAQRNAQNLGARVSFTHSQWFKAIATQKFELIVSNPPYIRAADPHLTQGDLRFEPLSALVAGPSGLDDLTHIITHAQNYLLPGGMLWLEHGYDQAPAVQALLNAQHFTQIQTYPDLNGMPRVTCGQMH